MASWVPLVFGIIGFIAGLVGFVTTLLNIRKHKKYNIPKGEWHYVGKLQDVNIKSTPGLVLTKFEWVDIAQQCNDTNYQKFMLLNSNGKLMFAADYPQMLHIKATMLNDRTIQFTAPNMPPLVINIQSDFIEPLGLKTKKYKTVRKPLVRLHLLEGDAEQHKWFSQFILNKEKGVRLYLNIKPSIFKNWWLYGNSDFFPLIVLQTKSLEDFNSRLTKGHHVTAAELNGNLLIDTSTATNIKPYDEDRWHWLRIGEDDKESAYLKFKSYCYHASGPSVNGGTAENEKTAELLSTLKSYRLLDKPDDPVMGSYYTVRRPGPIKPNAKVYMQFSLKDRKQV